MIEWVNHSSFVVEHDGSRLICDPWLGGCIFNRSWRLYSPSVFTTEDFARTKFIWYSHQHPDHFYPPDLLAIPAAVRRDITVLYHHTIDKKVVRFCSSLGFKENVELRDGNWHELTPGFKILCGTWFDRDSWIAIRTPDLTVLNINDCVVDSHYLAERIARQVRNVDVLVTQFSYAQFVGNPDETGPIAQSAREKLERIRTQVDVFKPHFVVPAASFVYWCHDENFFMNERMNRPYAVAEYIAALPAVPIVLYPGERWDGKERRDWRTSARRYEYDIDARLAEGPANGSVSVAPALLERAMRAFINRLKTINPLVRLFPARSTTVELFDIVDAAGAPMRYTLTRDAFRRATESDQADIIMHSESLLFCLRAPWGSNALHISSRFRSIGKRHGRFIRFFKPADWADHGYTLETKRLPLLIRAAAFRVQTTLAKRLRFRRVS